MNKDSGIAILYVHANNTDIGGADYCLFKLVSSLNREIFTPIVCLTKKTRIVELYEKESIDVNIVNMVRLQKRSDFRYWLSFIHSFFPTIICLWRIIKSKKILLVHANDSLDIYGPVAGWLARIETIQHMRLSAIEPYGLKLLIGWFAFFLNEKILSVSDAVASEFFSYRKQKLPKIETCYDWVDMEKVGHGSRKSQDVRKELSIPPSALVIGNVGRLEYLKGQHLFIEAANIVTRTFPNAHFIIVGGTVNGRRRENYLQSLRNRVKELGLQEKVIFIGERSDILDIMNCFDVFVLSTVSIDSFPGVVLEAMACGKPVVGPNAGGVPEQVENGKSGILYTPNNFKTMAEAIAYLLSLSKEKRNQMGQEGKSRVRNLFTREKIYPKIERIYKEVLNLYFK